LARPRGALPGGVPLQVLPRLPLQQCRLPLSLRPVVSW